MGTGELLRGVGALSQNKEVKLLFSGLAGGGVWDMGKTLTADLKDHLSVQNRKHYWGLWVEHLGGCGVLGWRGLHTCAQRDQEV